MFFFSVPELILSQAGKILSNQQSLKKMDPQTPNKIMDRVNELAQIYKRSRGVGHTELMARGAVNYEKPFVILTVDRNHARWIKDKYPVEKGIFISLNDLSYFRGRKEVPICIDNYSIMTILDDVIYLDKTWAERYKRQMDISEGHVFALQHIYEYSTKYTDQIIPSFGFTDDAIMAHIERTFKKQATTIRSLELRIKELEKPNFISRIFNKLKKR